MTHGLPGLTIGIVSLAFGATASPSGGTTIHGATPQASQLAHMIVAAAYRKPARGSADRAAIMDAARGPITAELDHTVIFVVSTLRTDGEWAYLDATPVNPDGSPLDWKATPFAEAQAAGMMEDNVLVLLRKKGKDWKMVDYVIGPSDVYWLNWIDQYGLPKALFNDD